MGVEEWHGVSHNLLLSAEHTASYTRFLEEQILLAHKRSNGVNVGGGRIGTAHSLRASLHTPRGSESGVHNTAISATWTAENKINTDFASLHSLQWSPTGADEDQLNYEYSYKWRYWILLRKIMISGEKQ